MIQINLRKLPSSSSTSISTLSDRLTANVSNKVCDDFANKLKRELKDKKCSKCSYTRGTITIQADKKDLIKISKSNFCCKEFEDSIQINIKK